MFWHNFKYAFKTLLKNKILLFWTFAFPIILGTFFNMAFSNIENSEKLEVMDIAIVNDNNFENNEMFKDSFEVLSDENNKERIFNTKYTTIDKAKSLLENDEITGYLVMKGENPKIVVNGSGTEETILKYVTEEIIQTSDILKNVVTSEMTQGNKEKADYEAIYQKVLEIQNTEVNIKDTSSDNLSYTLIEFYTLIAMTCLYGGILGMVSINQTLANMSSNGKRVSVSPVSKGKLVLGSVLAGYITQLIGVALLFVYTIFILHIDYGNNLPLIILLSMTGCLAGLSLGVMLATLVKSNENMKIGIIIAVTMAGCFLSGMMGIEMKYIIDTNAPIVNLVNPASMITDGLYSLYYYDTFNRYFLDVVSLIIFSLIMIGLSFISLRRQKYDSI